MMDGKNLFDKYTSFVEEWGIDEIIEDRVKNGLKSFIIVGIDSAKSDIGRIEEGALADILIVDTRGYSFLSKCPFEANLIYSAHSDCIASVICDGRFLMRDRVVPGEKEILSQARKYISRIG